MSEQLIDPSGIPHFIGDLATLDTDVTNVNTHAGEFRSAGADVHAEFQGLSAFYQAPEADQLFASTLPVKTKTDAFADDLEQVSSALSAYSTEVQPLVKKLDTLKADATAFVNSVSGDDDWRKDQDKVDHNNDLWHDVNHTVAAFQSAERAAYNKIMALIGGTALTTDDGSHAKNMYGFKAGDLDHAEETPWGSSAERGTRAWPGSGTRSRATCGTASSSTACGAPSRAWAPSSAPTAGRRQARPGSTWPNSEPPWPSPPPPCSALPPWPPPTGRPPTTNFLPGFANRAPP